VMYLVATFVFFLLGGTEALLMRLQLGAPDNTLLDPETYNAIMTMHGTTMVFLFVVPVWAGFANYMVPLMIGARDVAFPRLNARCRSGCSSPAASPSTPHSSSVHLPPGGRATRRSPAATTSQATGRMPGFS
jgi:hypothetical protein